jgi:hypothetical protein
MPFSTENPLIDMKPDRGPQILYMDDGVAVFHKLAGSPEGVIAANAGSIATTRGGEAYLKTTDTVATGWQQISAATTTFPSPVTITGTNPTLIFDDTDGADSSIAVQDGVITMNGLVVKANGYIVGVPRVLPGSVNTTPVGNVGVGTDPLHSFLVPADTWSNDGDFVEAFYGGLYANNVNTKRLTVTANGVTILDSGLRDLRDGGINVKWSMHLGGYRLNSTTVRFSIDLIGCYLFVTPAGASGTSGTAGAIVVCQGADAPLPDLNANPIALLVSAQATSNDDVVQLSSRVLACQMS